MSEKYVRTVAFEQADGCWVTYEGRVSHYLLIGSVLTIDCYEDEDALKVNALDKEVRSVLWRWDDTKFCDDRCCCKTMDMSCQEPISRFKHLHVHRNQQNTCNCSIPASFFPIVVVYNATRKQSEIVYPTEDERNKLLKPSSHPVLEDILTELRFNPDAGAQIQQARKRFYDDCAKNDIQ